MRPAGFPLRAATSRLTDGHPAKQQIVLAVTAAYALAHYVLGHDTPLLAVTTTITALGLSRDARPRRVIETAGGILIGIVLTELWLQLIGKGTWQIAVVLLSVLALLRFLTASSAFVLAAGTQSMIVLLLPDPEGGPFVRSIDSAIGGLVALLVTVLLPRDPRRLSRRAAEQLFACFTGSLGAAVEALRRAEQAPADRALERLRASQPLIDAWGAALESAVSIARLSPFHRRSRDDLGAQQRVLHRMDLATRNLRVIVRRVDFVVADGRPRPELAELLAAIATAVETLGASLDRPQLLNTARYGLLGVAGRLDPRIVLPQAEMGEAVLVFMLRPLLVDLLVATGLPDAEARAALPRL
jgi:uncharacterized membrane protein YgaE (UPF0421/DUF939 family)